MFHRSGPPQARVASHIFTIGYFQLSTYNSPMVPQKLFCAIRSPKDLSALVKLELKFPKVSSRIIEIMLMVDILTSSSLSLVMSLSLLSPEL